MIVTTEKTYTFDQLDENQKQIITAKWCSYVAQFRDCTNVVEYILNKSYEDTSAPFSNGDITNNEPTGSICIDGEHWEDLTDEGREAKLEFYQYLLEKWEVYCDKVPDIVLDTDLGEEYDVISARHEKIKEKVESLEAIISELESLECEEYKDVFHWMQCNDYVCRKLASRGQITLNNKYWGRTITGQKIVFDYIAQELAFEHYCDYGENFITHTTLTSLGAV